MGVKCKIALLPLASLLFPLQQPTWTSCQRLNTRLVPWLLQTLGYPDVAEEAADYDYPRDSSTWAGYDLPEYSGGQ